MGDGYPNGLTTIGAVLLALLMVGAVLLLRAALRPSAATPPPETEAPPARWEPPLIPTAHDWRGLDTGMGPIGRAIAGETPQAPRPQPPPSEPPRVRGNVRVTGLRLELQIRHVDGQGQATQRRVTVREARVGVDAAGRFLVGGGLEAVCHLRSFSRRGLHGVTDPLTGEVADGHDATTRWLAGRIAEEVAAGRGTVRA